MRGKNNIHEIDVIALDEDDDIIFIAECKARKRSANKEQISKFLDMLKDVKQGREGEELKRGYFVSFGGFSPEALDMIKGKVNDSGKYKVGRWSSIEVFFMEERKGGKILQLYP